MAKTIGMVSLGCSKNQVDAEHILADFRHHGFTISGDLTACDAVIVNTCGFIEDAKKESIENILELCAQKGQGKLKVVAVTGCLAERYQEQLAEEMPETDVVLGIGRNGEVVSAIDRALAGERVVCFDEKDKLSMEGERLLANDGYFAYLKIAEGCDNRCTYCAIPLIRGAFRSRPMETILEEAKTLAAQGVVELNVVAQDTTRYGEDLYGKLMLPELLTELCKIEGLHWIRVLYGYPDRITDELIAVMAKEPKIVKYIDIPIQHASGKVLKDMNRRWDRQWLTDLFSDIRKKMPGVALRTTLIAGFPGETDEDFSELCRFVDEVEFERLGCFTYSREEDTPAFDLPDQIDEEVKVARAEAIMTRQMDIMEGKNKALIGRVFEVLVEGLDEENNLYVGRSYMDAPDIDTKTYFTSEKTLSPGDFVWVKIEDFDSYDLIGSMVEKEESN